MRRQLAPALGMLLVFTVLTGLAYPLFVLGVAQAGFGDRAAGSLVERDGEVVGSELISQPFTGEEWFHPRPSATDHAPGPGNAAGSNEGPTSERLLTEVEARVQAYRERNGLAEGAPVPVDAVTGSGSSLDPHISVANARLQAVRVAEERDLDLDRVLALVEEHTDQRALGFLGEPGVNVLLLNLAVDATA